MSAVREWGRKSANMTKHTQSKTFTYELVCEHFCLSQSERLLSAMETVWQWNEQIQWSHATSRHHQPLSLFSLFKLRDLQLQKSHMCIKWKLIIISCKMNLKDQQPVFLLTWFVRHLCNQCILHKEVKSGNMRTLQQYSLKSTTNKKCRRDKIGEEFDRITEKWDVS